MTRIITIDPGCAIRIDICKPDKLLVITSQYRSCGIIMIPDLVDVITSITTNATTFLFDA